MMRYASLAVLSTLLLAGAAPLALDELYRSRAFVTGQDEADRGRGFALCLEDVLVKLSGDPGLRDDPRLPALKADAARLVAEFRYRDRMAGIPVHDEQGTRERPYDLFVTFDRVKIDAALRALDRAPWLERPRVAVFLGVRDQQTSYVLTSDGARGLGQREALTETAARQGLPIVLPTTQVIDAAGVTFARLAAAAPSPDAAAAGGEVALSGTLVWSEPRLGWIGTWHIEWRGRAQAWRISGVSFDDAFRNAVDGALRILSGHGAPGDAQGPAK